ncbi:MAG: hypothetical protein H0T92_14375 [Pyrinomonadaceae bacterium]|nr:hypothetical protein [Pyrinomonadaceae bacterium]
MADEKEKAQDKNKQEILREKAEKMGGTVVNSGGNMGAGKSGEIIMGGTEPTEETDASKVEDKG